MAQTLLATKIITIIIALIFSSFAFGSPGSGHSHGPEGDYTMQIVGGLVILAISGAVVWFLANKKK